MNGFGSVIKLLARPWKGVEMFGGRYQKIVSQSQIRSGWAGRAEVSWLEHQDLMVNTALLCRSSLWLFGGGVNESCWWGRGSPIC